MTEGKIKKLLLIRTDSLGDNVIFSSVLPYIRKKFKEWEITLACKKSILPLYDFCPFINEVIDIESDYKKDYDLAINSVYSRTLLSDSFTLQSGAKKTIAFTGDAQLISPEKISLWENSNKQYSKLIEVPGGDNSSELDKYYYLLKELEIMAKNLKPLVWLSPVNYSDSGYIVIFCGSGWPYKYVYNLGRALNDFIDNGTKIIALGSLSDFIINQVNLDDIKFGEKLNLCGETSIHQAIHIINNAKLVIGTDTGLGHIACALDKDNIILVGGGHPGRFFPYHKRTLLARKEMDCYGCNWICNIRKKFDCLNIPDEIIKEKIYLLNIPW